MKQICTIAIFVLFVLVGLPLHAAVILSSADTWVQVGDADTNHGGESTMVAANDGGSLDVPKGDDSWSIFRFDLSSFSGPIGSATLQLVYESVESGGGSLIDYELYAVADGGADENFNESTYTFNSSAYKVTTIGVGHDGGLDKNNAALTLLGSFSTVTAPETITFSSANLVDFANNDSNDILTLILFQDADTADKRNHYFSTHEAASGQPQLTLESPAVPEPSSLAMLILGGLALGARRCRRAYT